MSPHSGIFLTDLNEGVSNLINSFLIKTGREFPTGDKSTIAAEMVPGTATRSTPKIGRSKRGSGKNTA